MKWIVYYLDKHNRVHSVEVYAGHAISAVSKAQLYSDFKVEDVLVVGRKEMEDINDVPDRTVAHGYQTEMVFSEPERTQ